MSPPNDFTTLNPGVGGDDMDETATSYTAAPNTRKKPRVVVAGGMTDGVDVVQPLATSPVGSEYALPTRNMPATPITSSLIGAQINVSGAGDTVIISGVALQTIRVFKLFLVAEAATTLKFKNGAGADFTPYMKLTAGGSIVLDFDSIPWFVTSVGDDFIINLSAGVQVSGRVMYQQS